MHKITLENPCSSKKVRESIQQRSDLKTAERNDEFENIYNINKIVNETTAPFATSSCLCPILFKIYLQLDRALLVWVSQCRSMKIIRGNLTNT